MNISEPPYIFLTLIHTVMISGENPLTAAAIAAEARVDDFRTQATPEGNSKAFAKDKPPADSSQ